MTKFVPIITLCSCALSVALCAIALPLLCRVIQTQRKVISAQLVATLITWLIGSVGCLAYCGHIILFWRGDDSLYSIQWTFWLGTLYFCAMAPLSFAIFFVTLDRIIALQKPTLLTSANRKRMLYAQIIVEVGSYVGMVLYEVIPEMPDGDKITSCMVYGCTSDMAGVKITNMKLYFAVLNSAAALIFTFLFVRYNRQRLMANQQVPGGGKRINRHNVVAAITVLMEVTFNCVPNVVGYLAHVNSGIVLSAYVGPYVAYCFAIECFLTVMMYVKIMKIRVLPKGESHVSSTRPFHSTTSPPKPVVVMPKATRLDTIA